ncbi:Uncharacterised protein [Vibrio cholerae]|nr:Uncharacterised protein [Vibrio cholerae]
MVQEAEEPLLELTDGMRLSLRFQMRLQMSQLRGSHRRTVQLQRQVQGSQQEYRYPS